MKTKMFAMMLLLSGITCCDAFGNGLLSRMLGRGGCGGASSCCDTGSSCGAGLHVGLDVSLHLPKLRRGGGCGGGCDTGCDGGAVTKGCGCDQVAAAPCGCCDSGNSCAGGLLSGFSGFGNRGCDPCGRSGILQNLRGRLCSFGNRGCDSGCDSGCDAGCGAGNGCDAGCGGAVSNGCGCDNNAGRGCGGAVSNGCGCDNAAANGCGGGAVSNGCGCDNVAANGCGNACDCGRPARQICIKVPNFGLLDRVRSIGNGRGCGNGCGNGCDNGCTSGAPVVGAGCGCAGTTSAVIGDAVPAQTTQPTATPGQGATSFHTPTVDPNAFTIRGAKYGNN